LAVGGLALRPLARCLCSPGLAFSDLRAVARDVAAKLTTSSYSLRPRVVVSTFHLKGGVCRPASTLEAAACGELIGFIGLPLLARIHSRLLGQTRH
jgi:hypothetical protein